jgi:hypothetical protein
LNVLKHVLDGKAYLFNANRPPPESSSSSFLHVRHPRPEDVLSHLRLFSLLLACQYCSGYYLSTYHSPCDCHRRDVHHYLSASSIILCPSALNLPPLERIATQRTSLIWMHLVGQIHRPELCFIGILKHVGKKRAQYSGSVFRFRKVPSSANSSSWMQYGLQSFTCRKGKLAAPQRYLDELSARCFSRWSL